MEELVVVTAEVDHDFSVDLAVRGLVAGVLFDETLHDLSVARHGIHRSILSRVSSKTTIRIAWLLITICPRRSAKIPSKTRRGTARYKFLPGSICERTPR